MTFLVDVSKKQLRRGSGRHPEHEPPVLSSMLAAESAQQARAMSSPTRTLPAPARDGARGAPVVFVDPTMISVAHWGRLDEGERFAKSRHIDWAVWMKRTWGIDVMRCPAYTHRLRVVATITERAVVSKILDHVQVRKTPLPRAPARDPNWVQKSFEYEHEAA
jgi:hypothetical protein